MDIDRCDGQLQLRRIPAVEILKMAGPTSLSFIPKLEDASCFQTFKLYMIQYPLGDKPGDSAYKEDNFDYWIRADNFIIVRRVERARGNHVWWYWNASFSSITGWHTSLLMMQIFVIDYVMREKLFSSWILGCGKNQGDETNHRNVINDDGIFDIRVMNVLPKQALTAVIKC